MQDYIQMNLFEEQEGTTIYRKADALDNIRALYSMWKKGLLGGELMPEDSNPGLSKDSDENYHYFTLPMALNYQRDSYKLWTAASQAFADPCTNYLFNPNAVITTDVAKVRDDLLKYKVALQPNKHTEIWVTICRTIAEELKGTIKSLFQENGYRVANILEDIQVRNKKKYPYLSGNKIANYWLYVMSEYTSLQLVDKNNISVAPDTHVIQATYKLGLIDNINTNHVQADVAMAWREILSGSEFAPIDVHTPMWLWSRGGFVPIQR